VAAPCQDQYNYGIHPRFHNGNGVVFIKLQSYFVKYNKQIAYGLPWWVGHLRISYNLSESSIPSNYGNFEQKDSIIDKPRLVDTNTSFEYSTSKLLVLPQPIPCIYSIIQSIGNWNHHYS
jgi:hypothetical protein